MWVFILMVRCGCDVRLPTEKHGPRGEFQIFSVISVHRHQRQSSSKVWASAEANRLSVSPNNPWRLHRITGRITLIYDFKTFLASCRSVPCWNAGEQAGVGVYVAATHSYLLGKVHVGRQCKAACGPVATRILHCCYGVGSTQEA